MFDLLVVNRLGLPHDFSWVLMFVNIFFLPHCCQTIHLLCWVHHICKHCRDITYLTELMVSPYIILYSLYLYCS